MKEIREVTKSYKQACERAELCALATVVRVSGSTYRRAGARMLVTEEGKTTGSVSGGCLETDVVRRARRVMPEGETTLVTYDTTDEDDVLHGVGLGCQGVIQVFIEALPKASGETHLVMLAKWLDRREAGVLATVFRGEGAGRLCLGARLLLSEAGATGDITPPALAEAVCRDAREVLLRRRSESRVYALPDGIAEVFLEVLVPPVPLVLFGAGHDAEPLSRLAKDLGWHVTVVDGRGGNRTEERFPTADAIIRAGPDEARRRVSLDASTVAVLMTHNYPQDRRLLELLLPSPVGYLGLLGPRSRAERLLAELREAGVPLTAAQRSRLYAPVGLDIGADTAEEIALSILAEVRAVLAGRAGGALRDRQTPIHRREEEDVPQRSPGLGPPSTVPR